MPKLTKIVAQTGNSDRVSLFADGKFLTGLNRFTWIQLGLKVGDELSPQQVEQMKNEDTNGKCYDKALKLLSLRPQSGHELRQKLSKRFVSDNIGPTLARLTQEGLINDERFAVTWVNERILTRHRSVPHLVAELQQKGIDRLLIQSAIAKLDKQAEVRSALQLARRSAQKTPEKLRAYLARRGFGYSVIRQVEQQLQAQE